MSVRHSSSTPHHSQSLPSFAQAFSNSSLDRISAHNNALPPIQPHTAPMQRSISQQDTPPPGESSSSRLGVENGVSRHNGRKRSHPEMPSNIRGEETSDSLHRSPRLVLVKEEQDELIDDRPSPHRQSRPHLAGLAEGNSGGPTPQQPVSKKRRVTVSGHTQSIETGVSPSVADPNNAAPLSPVVMGFSMRDDPAAIEQMRSVLTIKQSQKALIEQRRGSVGGPPPSTAQGGQGNTHTPPVNVPTAPHPNRPSAPVTRTGVRSPSMGGGRVRASFSGPELPLSPNAPHATNQQQPPPEASSHTQTSGGPFSNALPPPPISFARRRAGAAGKKKPADIVISPRDPQTNTRLQPVIQSAPAIAHGPPGRFPMALPSLPPVLGQGQPMRRVAPGNVPPTPTRLSMRGAIAAGSTSAGTGVAPTTGGVPTSGRSPPASVPIAATLVPPTPASLQHPGYSSDKASFLAPFEVFYDALRDAKELKAWLGEQLQKSQSLQASLVQQHEKLEQVVEAAVERRVGAMRDEISGLRRRIGELEDALHAAGVGSSGQPRRHSLAIVDTTKGRSMGSGSIVSPTTSSNVVPDTYTFPPVEPPGAPRPESGRLLLSPTQRERDVDVRSNGESQNDSPAPYDINRRLSVSAVTSAVRMDPPPAPAHQPESSGPAPRSREHPPPPSSTKGKGTGSPRHSHFAVEHSATHRRASTNQNEDAEHGAGRHPSRSIPGEQKRDTVYTSPRSLPASPMDDS